MAAFTLKKIPDQLLERIRSRAEEERRSVTQEIYHLLEQALNGVPGGPREAHRQVEAWSQLSGRWQSDESRGAEIGRIYESRTPGRGVTPGIWLTGDLVDWGFG